MALVSAPALGARESVSPNYRSDPEPKPTLQHPRLDRIGKWVFISDFVGIYGGNVRLNNGRANAATRLDSDLTILIFMRAEILAPRRLLKSTIAETNTRAFRAATQLDLLLRLLRGPAFVELKDVDSCRA
jgi:hypothetical protein